MWSFVKLNCLDETVASCTGSIRVCVCVCACVCVRACACVCARVRVRARACATGTRMCLYTAAHRGARIMVAFTSGSRLWCPTMWLCFGKRRRCNNVSVASPHVYILLSESLQLCLYIQYERNRSRCEWTQVNAFFILILTNLMH